MGTLDDSIVKLYDEDGALLDSNNDYGGTLASRRYWEADSVNDYLHYIAVEGHGIGTYTLTVSIVDDHGNDFESATRIAIGEGVRILLHYDDDRDVLVFRARQGTEYVLTLDYQTGQRRGDAAGTTMALYDAGGWVLADLRNYFSSNRKSEQDNVASCDRRRLLHCSRERRCIWHFRTHRNREVAMAPSPAGATMRGPIPPRTSRDKPANEPRPTPKAA